MYQEGTESKPVFDGCSEIIVFLGEENPNSRFVGVYEVGTRIPAKEAPLPPECPHPEWTGPRYNFYPLRKRAGFEDLQDRLIIDWGKAALAWHQWFSDRPVIEIRPAGRALPPFRDYLPSTSRLMMLVRLASQPDAHRDWVAGLSAVGATYIIVDSLTGDRRRTGRDACTHARHPAVRTRAICWAWYPVLAKAGVESVALNGGFVRSGFVTVSTDANRLPTSRLMLEAMRAVRPANQGRSLLFLATNAHELPHPIKSKLERS